ncbi:hypothetical protein D3C81_1358100 [compost metagenome]
MLERRLAQRALADQLGGQPLDVALGRAYLAAHLVGADVALDQHHAQLAVAQALGRQEGVGQRIAVLLVALGDGAGNGEHFAQGHRPTEQRVEQRGDFLKGIDAAALDQHIA